MLDEKQGNLEKVPEIVKRGFKKLQKMQADIKRKQWVDQAINCEKDGYPISSKAILGELQMYRMEEEVRGVKD